MSQAEVLQRLRLAQALPRRPGDDHLAWLLVRLAARLAELELLLEQAQTETLRALQVPRELLSGREGYEFEASPTPAEIEGIDD